MCTIVRGKYGIDLLEVVELRVGATAHQFTAGTVKVQAFMSAFAYLGQDHAEKNGSQDSVETLVLPEVSATRTRGVLILRSSSSHKRQLN
jgi:hypothetical protein